MRAKMQKIVLLVFGFVGTSMAIAACGDLTGPKSPETPINVTATLIAGNAVQIMWAPSPQSDGVISYNILRNGTKIGEATTLSYVDTQVAEKTTYKYSVSANCTSGVLSDPSPESAAATVTTIDVTAPRITSVNPFAGQTGVSTFATVTATFNEAMDPATLNTTTFSLKVTSSGQNIPGTVTYNPATNVATFTPASQLPSLTNLTATVTAGVKDLAGNALALTPGSPGIWSFTTSDQTPPTIISVVPTSGAVGVPATTSVSVTFSEAMDASTIIGTNINLRVTSSGAFVAGTVNYNTTTHIATFTPSSPLNTPVSYTFTVLAAVKDVAGNPMEGNFQSSFTTADLTPPTVVSTVPTNLATGVPTNTVVSATFSKPMNATTINGTTFTVKVTATSAAAAGTVAYNAATNTATFTPSAPLASLTTYTATITTGAKDTFGNAVAANFNWTFSTADVTPPTILLPISPAANATNVLTNTAVNITFSEGMDATTINTTNITVKNTATSALVAGVVSYNAGTHVATFTPNVPLANGTGYTVTVTTGVKDAAGNALASQFTSTFSTAAASDTTPPTVTSTAPPDAQTVVGVSTIITATFSEAMNASTIDGTTFTLKTTSGGTPVTGTVTYNAGTFSATFTLTSPLANSTNYTATITTGVKDVSGNALAANKVWAFTTVPDNTPPIVSSTSPTDGATNVAIATVVTATFSEAMDATTISGTTFTLKTTVGATTVAGTVSYNAGTRTATFTPTSPLANNTNYTATITTGAKDAAGNAMAANKVWAFTTIPDTTPPIVSSTSPTDGGTNVAITTAVTAIFSEPMNASTIGGTTFTLKTTSGGVPVAGSVSYSAGTNTATFTPTLALATNTVYTATITTGVKDTAGNAMAANKVWAFTTVP